MKKPADLSHPWYTPKRDGDLKTHLENTNYGTNILFKGFKHYEMLWNQGFLEPGMSYIRLMWNSGRGDEFFEIRGLYEIEGRDDLTVHTARSGIHDPRKVLEEGPLFEAHYLNRNPVPRVPERKKC